MVKTVTDTKTITKLKLPPGTMTAGQCRALVDKARFQDIVHEFGIPADLDATKGLRTARVPTYDHLPGNVWDTYLAYPLANDKSLHCHIHFQARAPAGKPKDNGLNNPQIVGKSIDLP